MGGERVTHKKYTTIWPNQILYITYTIVTYDDLANLPLLPLLEKAKDFIRVISTSLLQSLTKIMKGEEEIKKKIQF